MNRRHKQYQANPSLRLMTFSRWKSRDVTADDLADAGFVYTGVGDKVTCVFCNNTLGRWDPGDDPAEEHTRHFPECSGIGMNWREDSGGCVVADNGEEEWAVDGAGRAAKDCSAWDFADMPSRIKSFNEDWPWKQPNLSPERMAKAGFYFCGSLGKKDRVKCFTCAKQVGRWLATDDPVEEHKRWSPNCPYIKNPDQFCRDAHISGNVDHSSEPKATDADVQSMLSQLSGMNFR